MEGSTERGRRANRERERESVFFLGRNLVLAKFLTTHVRFFYEKTFCQAVA